MNTARKTLLNKRIAFPLSGGSTSQTQTTSLPPISLPPRAVNLPLAPPTASVLLPSEIPMETREQLESSLLMVSRILTDSLNSYIEKKDFARAENVRVALAVDYTSDCASWIMVIKNIITQMETKQIDL